MLKRVRWVGMGALLGAGGSVWAQVALRRKARRLRPAPAARRAAEGVAGDLRTALAEGRTAMREREEELRHRLEPPRR